MIKKITAPIKTYKAVMNGGSEVKTINSAEKMADFIRIAAEMHDCLDYLQKLSFTKKTPIYEVVEKINPVRFFTELETKLNVDMIEFESRGGIPTLKAYIVSREALNTCYQIHFSFLPELRKHCRASYNLYLECLRLLVFKGIETNDNVGYYSIEELLMDMDIDEHISDVSENDSHREELTIAAYKEILRKNNDAEKLIYEKPFCMKRLERYVKALKMDQIFHPPLLDFASKVLSLTESLPLLHYQEDSVQDWMDRNRNEGGDTDDDEDQSPPLEYPQLFYITNSPENLIGPFIKNYVESLANEYGYIEYFHQYLIHDMEDAQLVIDDLGDKHAMLTRLPDVFTVGNNFCCIVENYFDNLYSKKWKKEMPPNLQQLLASTS
jgi:hypothetical protein